MWRLIICQDYNETKIYVLHLHNQTIELAHVSWCIPNLMYIPVCRVAVEQSTSPVEQSTSPVVMYSTYDLHMHFLPVFYVPVCNIKEVCTSMHSILSWKYQIYGGRDTVWLQTPTLVGSDTPTRYTRPRKRSVPPEPMRGRVGAGGAHQCASSVVPALLFSSRMLAALAGNLPTRSTAFRML